jgi:hypothetical protein
MITKIIAAGSAISNSHHEDREETRRPDNGENIEKKCFLPS